MPGVSGAGSVSRDVAATPERCRSLNTENAMKTLDLKSLLIGVLLTMLIVSFMLIATNAVGGFGEVRQARAARFIAAIEPMHGTNVSLFTPATGNGLYARRVLDSSMVDGHALACGDLLGIGREQIVAGWRAMVWRVAPSVT